MTPIEFPKRKKRSFLSFSYKQVSYDGHFDSNRYLSTFLTSIPYPFETILVEHLHHISLSNAILKVSIFTTDLFMNFFMPVARISVDLEGVKYAEAFNIIQTYFISLVWS